MKKKIYDIFKIFLICFVLETILFNITTYISVIRKGEKQTFNIGDNYNFLYTDNEDEIIIPIDNINQNIKSLKLNLKENMNIDKFDYRIAYADETSKELRWMQNIKTCVNGNEKTEYISLFLSGNVSRIQVLIDNTAEVENGLIDSITINENIKFKFNILRFVIVFAIFLFIYLVKDAEKIFIKTSFKQEVCLLLIVFFAILIANTLNNFSGSEELDFYSNEFLSSIKNGQTNLPVDPSDKIKNLEDPYDTLVRGNEAERGKDYIWDTAYYNGKAYVYFGIVPLLLLFLPFNLITKLNMGCNVAVLIYSAFAFFLLKEILVNIINKYFKEVSFKIVVSALASLCFGSLILFLNGIPRYYEVAIISGLFFSLLGILLILQSEDKNSYIKMFFGCLSLALAVGCRPTYLFISLIILPILAQKLIKNVKSKNKKEVIKELIAVMIPYITVGLALMYYNYIRFDSIFEFGAKYQLTINNMAKLGSRLYTIPKRIIMQFI